MEIFEVRANDVVILTPTGRVDASNAISLEEHVVALIDAGERRLVLELKDLDYVSSAGLRVMLVAAKRLGAAGGKLALAAPQPIVREILDIAGLSTILQILPNAQAATEAVR
jgi:stage II sporulation protein AA (anti-sigma F factor antagonist)